MTIWQATLCLLLGSLTLTGCAALDPSAQTEEFVQDGTCRPLSNEQELLLNLSQEMVEENRLYAALANLEQLPAENPQVRLSKAKILRLLREDEAENLFRSLLDTCLVADAEHGLGQLAAGRGHYQEAAAHLRLAARKAPANAAIRNDLGVVYLNLRRLDDARFELMTALELDEDNPQPLQNLMTLMLYQGKWQQVSELMESRGLSPRQFEVAEQRAKRLQEEDL